MKDIKWIYCVFALLIVLVNQSFGQIIGIEEMSLKQLERYAKHSTKNGDIHTAILLYEQYRKGRKSNTKINYSLAELYRQARYYLEAEELYDQVVNEA